MDLLTPRPQVVDPDVLNEIRWEMGSNFDALVPAITMAVPLQDYVDPSFTDQERKAIHYVSNRDHLRVTFKPSSFSLDGTKTLWMRRIVRINGIDSVEPERYMLAPRQGVARPTYILSGTAPALALGDALQLELPAGMNSVNISVTSGSNLGVTFDKGAEQVVVAGVPEQVIVGTVSTLFLRGIGGASVFDIVMSKAYG